MSFDKPLNRFKSQTKANKLPLDVLYNLVVKPKSNKFLFPPKVLRRRPVLSESFTAAHSFSLQLSHPKASGEPRPVPILFYFQPMLESPVPVPLSPSPPRPGQPDLCLPVLRARETNEPSYPYPYPAHSKFLQPF